MTTLRVRDLVGIPWKVRGTDPEDGMDCRGLVFAGMQKLGVPVRRGDLGLEIGAEDPTEEVLGYIETRATEWKPVEKALLPGWDVILTETPPDDPAPLHLSLLVDAMPRTVLTTSRGTGSILVPSGLLRRTLGVYRWKGRRRP